MRFTILTLFPEFFDSPLACGLLGKGVEQGLVSVDLVNPRDFTEDRHRTVDDRPYGGGPGMVMRCEPLAGALESVPQPGRIVYMSPRGRRLDHGLSQYDANLVAWLVRAHLLMSLTAQRKDISDPDVVLEFATQVGNSMRLDYLYLLTVADIRGTNPELWNSWKDSLLSTLYGATQRMLRRGLDNPLDQDELVGEAQTQALELLRGAGMGEKPCLELWQEFEPEYFLRHSADEIAWHTLAVLEAHATPLVRVRQETARGSTEIFIYTDDHPHLFALTTTALTQLGLDIVDARIITTRNGRTLDTFLVLEDTGQPVSGTMRMEEIATVLTERISHPDRPPTAVVRNTPRRLRHFTVPTRIEFGDKLYFNRTVLAITTGDRPGLLSRIGTTLTRCGIKVHNAKIATAGEQADDVFYITDLEDRPIMDRERQAEIEKALREALE